MSPIQKAWERNNDEVSQYYRINDHTHPTCIIQQLSMQLSYCLSPSPELEAANDIYIAADNQCVIWHVGSWKQEVFNGQHLSQSILQPAGRQALRRWGHDPKHCTQRAGALFCRRIINLCPIMTCGDGQSQNMCIKTADTYVPPLSYPFVQDQTKQANEPFCDLNAADKSKYAHIHTSWVHYTYLWHTLALIHTHTHTHTRGRRQPGPLVSVPI